MTARGASQDDEQQDHGRATGRLLLVAALALALGAAAVLVLSDSARWLRLAVVAALWAALVGAFLAARYRRQVADRADEVADLQSVYELELEREVAARREYELEVEAETRKRVREEAKDDLEALRGELRALRENLEALLGGEVLVERVALRAESTRMRALSDQSRLMAVSDQRIITAAPAKAVGKKGAERVPVPEKVSEKAAEKAAAPGKAAKSADREKAADRTELIERVPHDTSRKDQARRPEPVRPDQSRREGPQPNRREAGRGGQRPATVRAAEGAVRVPDPTERVNRADLVGRPVSRVEPPKEPPRGPSRGGQSPAGQPQAQPQGQPQGQSKAEQTRMAPVRGDVSRVDAGRAAGQDFFAPARGQSAAEPAPQRRSRVAERTEMISRDALAEPVRRAAPPKAEPATTRRAAEQSGYSESVQVRHAEPAEPARGEPAAEAGGHRADGGGRRRAEDRPARREAPEPEGAHADGKSVSELLAAFGGGESPRRRRRRGED
ncbi:DUF6779 domain-containing protein [Saccharothrix obliqua]|uniref:DUF6779 domain-containing protein n=1 Tax=Saccharothrix obliqua TaxID=2861747 RepID=UPI001C606F1E|nr:DUF6779 domain-containing protein [Saccharothrix obliqua]MBW4719838.1 hypothetical protein [Saccharothrix obliqua]